MKKYILSVLLTSILLVPIYSQAQQSSLRDQIAEIAKPAKSIVGVSILGLESGDTVTYNGKARLVMESVMKFPIALTVLHYVDSGKFTLDQMIHISKKDLPKTYSPLRDKYPKGNVDVSIRDLLGYMISLSDNDACDILLKALNGPQTVQDYMLRIGIRGIAVRASEADMAAAPELQYADWVKPVEITQLLDLFYKDKILSKTNTDFLYKIMTETSTGPKRIKGLLPTGIVVAHKTGSSTAGEDGITPGNNDVGIIELPNGKHLAIAVFVCNSKDDEATRDGIMAKIAKAAFDFYNK